MSALIDSSLVRLDVNLGQTKDDTIRALAGVVAQAGRADADGLAADALAREAKSPTGMPGGFAIPHCRSAAVREGSLGFARLSQPVDFGAKDGPSDLVFLIAAAEDGGADHMKLLTKLARALVKPEFVESLRRAETSEAVVGIISGVLEPEQQPVVAAVAPTAHAKKIVAVTACPTGIAHTYMAADYLVNAGKELGIDVQVEPQGSSSTQKLDPSVIEAADAVIFATDVGVKGRERFAGLPVVESGVKRAVNEPKVMLQEALAAIDNPSARRVVAAATVTEATAAGSSLSLGKRTQQALMTGVSYMIPFVAAGGLLIALGFLFGGYDITTNAGDIVTKYQFWNLPPADLAPHALGHIPLFVYLGAVLFKLGALGFGFLVPALAGYIAFGIADRPGIAPGFIVGAVASAVGAGFLGGLVGGLLAGVIAALISRWKTPRWLSGLMPVVIIPLLTTLVAGGLMYTVLGGPLASLMKMLTDGLNSMNGSSAVLLGVVLGLMMCFDLGGPVNKAAYLFATAGLSLTSVASMKIMAAVMASGMVPPLALALATAIRPALFTQPERENGKAAWLLGASFISEGAIPFAAADPLRIIPSMMAGGAVTGALSMVLGVASKAPHGGIFVLFAMDNRLGFILAIVAGTVVSALLVLLLKGMKVRAASQTEVEHAK
ncbi:MAG: PTS fructose transporter subunit IIABC [Propionibacteriaceae bacterium]